MIKLMKKITKKILIIVLCSVSVVFAFHVLSKDRITDTKKDSYDLYIAIDSQDNTVTSEFMYKFAELAKKNTDGRVKVHCYSNSQLGSDVEILRALIKGNITFVVQTTAPQAPFVKEAAIFDSPFAFKDVKEARKILSGRVFTKLQEAYEQKGIRLLAFSDQGFRNMTSNIKVEKMSDFKSVKIRTMENKNHIDLWSKLGASPTPLAWSEVYIALSQGVIDAQENPLETIVASHVYEKQKYLIMTSHVLHTLSLIGSEKVLASLPGDLQSIIQKSADEAKDYASTIADERLAEKIKYLQEQGVEIIYPSEEFKRKMREKTDPVFESIRAQVGDELMDMFEEERNEDEK